MKISPRLPVLGDFQKNTPNRIYSSRAVDLWYFCRPKIKPYDILYIPFGWFYYQEINNPTILYHIDIDNYFTFIHNSILNKF